MIHIQREWRGEQPQQDASSQLAYGAVPNDPISLTETGYADLDRTPGRVADWHATGIRPTAAVWTPAQMAAFLDSVRGDRF